MIPRPHQVEGAKWALDTIRELGFAYLSHQERTGKTLTSLHCVEQSKAGSCLIITKKRAIPGWEETLNEWEHDTMFVVINYESCHKIVKKFDFIILDECFTGNTLVDGKPIKDYKVGDKVTTRLGLQEVYHIHIEDAPEELAEVTIGDRTIVCTPDHLFYTENRGWIKIKEATNEDVFLLQD